MTDDRNWQEEYNKLKINFDRLDRMNDVLYRYWYTANKFHILTAEEVGEANRAVLDFMEELENEYRRRRSSETQGQEG